MKKIIAITLALALLALLCACGETAEPTAQEPAPAPAAEEPAANQAPEQAGPVAEANDTPEESASTAEGSAEAPEEPAEPTALETALTLVGHDVSELAAAIGEPLDKAYEASCSGPGDDGIWTYDGLTVFTYRENGVETVVDAE